MLDLKVFQTATDTLWTTTKNSATYNMKTLINAIFTYKAKGCVSYHKRLWCLHKSCSWPHKTLLISQWGPRRTLGCAKWHTDFQHQNNPGFLLETGCIMLLLSGVPFDELMLNSLLWDLPLKSFTSSGLFMNTGKISRSKSQNWEFLLFYSGFSLVVEVFPSF